MHVEAEEKNKQSSLIDDLKRLVSSDFQAVDTLIQAHLSSHVPLIEQISQHIIVSGGKRLRPLIVLLVANAFSYRGKDHIILAAVVEFIHTATLLHDDVVDNSSMRRGQQTANMVWGNATSVLVGDFLYSRTFELLIKLNNLNVMDVLAKTTNAIAEGEVLQLVSRNDPDLSESQYMQVIGNKTARLFQAAAEVTALICQRSLEEIEAMVQFGFHLGMAFQLMDDALDYMGKSDTLGKNIGDDLAEGKATLPLIHAMQHADEDGASLINKAIREGGAGNNQGILEILQKADSLNYTLKKAEDQIHIALNTLSCLTDSVYKEALESLAHFSIVRCY